MPIFVGGSGKTFRVGVLTDISSNTGLDIKFISPTNVESTISNPRVTAPASGVVDPDVGNLSANEYMEFDTEVTDFTESGSWQGCATFTNTATTPDQIFPGTTFTFTVLDPC